MKFLCPACDRLADIESFRVEEGALRLRCGKCGVESAHAGAPLASATKPPPPPRPNLPPPPDPSLSQSAAPRSAPSGAPGPSVDVQPPAPAAPEAKLVLLRSAAIDGVQLPWVDDPLRAPEGFCPKCLSRRGAGPACHQCGLVFLVFKEEEVAPPDALANGFRSLLSSWQDNAAHDQFLQLAIALNALPAAARLYRIQLAHNPEDPFAARGRAEIVRLATASNPLTPSPRLSGQPVKPWQVALAVVVGLLLVAALVSLLRGVVAVGP